MTMIRRSADPEPMTLTPDLRAALDVARAELDAGQGIPSEDVWAWVNSWNTPQELPMPGAVAKQKSS